MERKFKKHCDHLYEIIFMTSAGRIYRNGIDKNQYMIEFGNMFLSMSHENMSRFEAFLTNTKDSELQQLVLPSINKIVLQPMKSLGSYAFTLCEFKALQELVLGAKHTLLIEQELNEILNR